MKTILTFLFPFVLFFSASAQENFDQGMNWYAKRAEGSKGVKADSEPISKAIYYFEKALQSGSKEPETTIHLMRSYIYKGRFAVEGKTEKRELFGKAKELGENIIAQYPKNVELRFEYLTGYGLWGEQLGIFKAAREGIADNVKDEIETLIELDPDFRNAIGQRALGVLHLMAPKIPFIMSWPSDEYGLKLTKNVVTRYPNDIGNNYFYAEALVENGKPNEAVPILKKVLSMQPHPEYVLEDRDFHRKAKIMLAKLQD